MAEQEQAKGERDAIVFREAAVPHLLLREGSPHCEQSFARLPSFSLPALLSSQQSPTSAIQNVRSEAEQFGHAEADSGLDQGLGERGVVGLLCLWHVTAGDGHVSRLPRRSPAQK